MSRKTLLIYASAVVITAVLYLIGGYVWKYYVAPRDSLAESVNQCGVEGDKVFGTAIAHWMDSNHSDVLDPYRRQRDDFIETCVKAEGWCSIGDDSIWPSSRPWAFAPRDPLARLLYDYRYEEGEHPTCTD